MPSGCPEIENCTSSGDHGVGGEVQRGHSLARGYLLRRPSLVHRLQLLPGSSAFFFLLFFTLGTGPRRSLSLKLIDTRVYAPQIRARLGTTAHFCRVETLSGASPPTTARILLTPGKSLQGSLAHKKQSGRRSTAGSRDVSSQLSDDLRRVVIKWTRWQDLGLLFRQTAMWKSQPSGILVD